MSSPEVVDARATRRARRALTRDWLGARAAARRDLVLPDARLGAGLVGDDRGADRRRASAAWRGAVRATRGARRAEPGPRAPAPRGSRSTCPSTSNAGSGAGAADHCGWLVPRDRRDEVAAWLAEAIGGRGPLLRGADPAWGRPPLPARRRVDREDARARACPCRARISDGRAARTSFAASSSASHAGWSGRGCASSGSRPARSTSALLRTLFELHARARARHGIGSSFGVEQLALHRRLAERSGAGRGPAAVVARRDGAVVGVLYGFWWKDTFAAYQWGWEAAMGPPQHGQRARLPGASASPRPTARARSTSCAAPSRTSTASAPPTGGTGRGWCRTDRAARCLRLDIERATWLIGRAVTPLFVERDGPRTAARRGPPDARP